MTKTKTHQYTGCPICNSSDIQVVLSAKDHTVSGESFEVWHCQECQLRFTQNIPVESEIGSYYQSEEYISHSNTSKGIVNRLYQWVRDYTLIKKRQLVQKVSGRKSGKILDIGCGTGEFLNTMKSSGWETLGLEPDPGARAQAQTNYGLNVEETENLFKLTDRYHVISMWHVLEHVHRLHENIDQIFSLLEEDGVLLIAVPNYRSLDAEKYQEYWAAYDVPRHLYHFSTTAMDRLLSDHRFEIDSIKKMPFDAFYVSLLSEKYQHGRLRLIAGFWNGLRSFLRSLNHSDQCSSILYVIRKSSRKD